MIYTNKALFLDRDGVINYDYGYVHKIRDFAFIPGIFELVECANQREYKVIIVTNQAGIARGYYSQDDFYKLNEWMISEFLKNNCHIDKVYFCPYHPEHGQGEYKQKSFDRKPNPGMLLKARDQFELSMNESIIIGDNESDLQAGLNSGIRHLYITGKNQCKLSNFLRIKNLSDFWYYHDSRIQNL